MSFNQKRVCIKKIGIDQIQKIKIRGEIESQDITKLPLTKKNFKVTVSLKHSTK